MIDIIGIFEKYSGRQQIEMESVEGKANEEASGESGGEAKTMIQRTGPIGETGVFFCVLCLDKVCFCCAGGVMGFFNCWRMRFYKNMLKLYTRFLSINAMVVYSFGKIISA